MLPKSGNLILSTRGKVPDYYDGIITEWERGIDTQPMDDHITQCWWLAFVYSTIYFVVIHTLKHIMKDRKPFNLDRLLIGWNTAMCIINVVIASRLLPEFYWTWKDFGWYGTLCDYSFADTNQISYLWVAIFGWLKLVEFGDTVFLVLRKRKLMFLHWYHHITVFCFMAYCAVISAHPSSRIFANVNTLIHCLMYGYYAVKLTNVHVPKSVSMTITILQITQMGVGVYVNSVLVWYRFTGDKCHASTNALLTTFALYFSYFVLFCYYFYEAYVISERNQKAATRKANNNVKNGSANGKEKLSFTDGLRFRAVKYILTNTHNAFDPSNKELK